MLSLQKEHIIDLFVAVDELLPEEPLEPGRGRPAYLSTTEIVTILLWNTLTVKQRTLKDIHAWIGREYQSEFPHLPQYKGFVAQCHRIIPALAGALNHLLITAPIQLVDSTMLPVCKLHRVDDYTVAKSIARFGKNHQGWHFGFKLHAAVDLYGRFCGLSFTPANVHDSQALPSILSSPAKVVVGDGAYTARTMNTYLWHTRGVFVLAPPHPKQNKKIMAAWQQLLLNMRSKIESTFDILKEHLGLVTSFPRSAAGYLLHYLPILLGYQLTHI